MATAPLDLHLSRCGRPMADTSAAENMEELRNSLDDKNFEIRFSFGTNLRRNVLLEDALYGMQISEWSQSPHLLATISRFHRSPGVRQDLCETSQFAHPSAPIRFLSATPRVIDKVFLSLPSSSR